MSKRITINQREIGVGKPVYIIAELSANHNRSFEEAVKIVEAAKEAGADAVKLQTYTPDTMTIDCDRENFQIGKGTIWEGKNLYQLYAEAYTPWEWQPDLKAIANRLDLDCFSTPFDESSVEFLEKMDVPAYKLASFELVDLPLIRRIARTKKPIIMSTGMATKDEIQEAIQTARENGCCELALLKCTSAYPASLKEMNLRTIPDMVRMFGLPVGLSDHTLEATVPVAAVALGACIVEKHITLSRSVQGPDSVFSLEPDEFKHMVCSIRKVEKALGEVCYDITEGEVASRVFRRSLFVIRDIRAGETFTNDNVRVIRPGDGLHTRHIESILGRTATCDLERGAPLTWDMIDTKRNCNEL
ncbi:MAG: pseudaminic acid synthase [Thermodesulfovibrionales bacterium]|nr:pseudaminic acid synthase [Thermodesulfovibrionales bacterium]